MDKEENQTRIALFNQKQLTKETVLIKILNVIVMLSILSIGCGGMEDDIYTDDGIGTTVRGLSPVGIKSGDLSVLQRGCYNSDLLQWSQSGPVTCQYYGQNLSAQYKRSLSYNWITATQVADTGGNYYGECVSFVKSVANRPMGISSSWTKGSRVMNGGVDIGTIIATFRSGNNFNPNSSDYTGVFAGYSGSCLMIYDQNYPIGAPSVGIRFAPPTAVRRATRTRSMSSIRRKIGQRFPQSSAKALIEGVAFFAIIKNMKKYLLIILVIPLVFWLGFLIFNRKTTPALDANQKEWIESNPNNWPEWKKFTFFDPFANVTSTKLFSDPKTDFTFEYPSGWTYGEFVLDQKMYSDKRSWFFHQGDETVLQMYFNTYSLYESTGITCYQAVKEGLTEPDYFSKFIIYPTNDPKTTIVSEVCGSSVTLRWEKGLHPQTMEEIERNLTGSRKEYVIITGLTNTEITKPTQNVLDGVDRIVRSIRILK